MPRPLPFLPAGDFWATVQERLPANQGHAQNIFPHGPYVGTIGEVAFEHWFRAQFPQRGIRHVGETWRDYVASTRTAATNRLIRPQPAVARDELSIEVKTKLRSRFPLEGTGFKDWEVSVPDYLLEHLEGTPKPEVIVAVSVQSELPEPTKPSDISGIVILGWIPYGTFQDWKVWVPKGTIMGGGRQSPRDMWNVFIRQLNDPGNL